jgi:uncharacterized protein (TIRG00374 family)
MQEQNNDVLKKFSPSKIVYPILIGLGVAAFLFYRGFNADAFSKIEWTWSATNWLILAVVSVVIRDLAYMIRIRILTENHLSWYRSFIVIMLWEFSSALAPTLIGGGFVFAILILSREGVNMGKSITTITVSNFLDGIFLAIMAPLIYFIVSKHELFSGLQVDTSLLGSSVYYTFWVIFWGIIILKSFIGYALFFNPYIAKKVILGIFSLKILSRFKEGAAETAEQLIISSKELRTKKRGYWVWSIVTTFITWTARFSIVNCIIHAFHGAGSLNDLAMYGKQIVIQFIGFASPTPGASGVSEAMFETIFSDYIMPGLSATLGLLWRLISYYPYLIIGAIILPRWIKEKVL